MYCGMKLWGIKRLINRWDKSINNAEISGTATVSQTPLQEKPLGESRTRVSCLTSSASAEPHLPNTAGGDWRRSSLSVLWLPVLTKYLKTKQKKKQKSNQKRVHILSMCSLLEKAFIYIYMNFQTSFLCSNLTPPPPPLPYPPLLCVSPLFWRSSKLLQV